MDYIQINQYCLEIIRNNLQIFVTKAFINKYGENNYMLYLDNNTYNSQTKNMMTDTTSSNLPKYEDALYYLNLFQKNWEILSSYFSSNYALSLTHSLKYFRNKIAHQAPISLRMIYRFVDETQALLEEICLGVNDVPTLEMIRKELIKQMLNCNDNIIVMGKSNYNSFEDINVEMKSDNQITNNTCKNNMINDTLNQKIETNYNKIINNTDIHNFYPVKTIDEEEQKESNNTISIIQNLNNFNNFNY